MVTAERVTELTNILAIPHPDTHPLPEWAAGYNAALKVVASSIRMEDAVMAGFPEVQERAASAADFADWQESEMRLAWGDR